MSVRESAVRSATTGRRPCQLTRSSPVPRETDHRGRVVDHEVVAGPGLYQVVAVIATQKVAPSAPMEPVSTRAATHQVVASPRANAIVPSPGDDDVPARGTDQVVVSVCTHDRRCVPEAGLRSDRGRSPMECESTEQRNRAKRHGRCLLQRLCRRR